MFIITKMFNFEASHQLRGLPEDHPCARCHGHSYRVEFELVAAHLNKVGFVRDYRELDCVKRYVDECLDHQHLNEVLKPLNPTAENIACFLYHRFLPEFPELQAVRVSETAKTWAEYRSDVAKGEYGEEEELEEVAP